MIYVNFVLTRLYQGVVMKERKRREAECDRELRLRLELSYPAKNIL